MGPRDDDGKRPPKTGVTRFYDFTISRGTVAPDGYSKPSILINGQFPGPLIEANWGDEIQGTRYSCAPTLSLVPNELLQWSCTTALPRLRKAQLSIGMVCCNERHLGWTAYPVLPSVPLLLAQPSRALLLSRFIKLNFDAFFSYRFTADVYGTSWYHSHYSSQLIDGVYGPLVIYGPSHVPFDHDLGPIVIQDCMVSYLLM